MRQDSQRVTWNRQALAAEKLDALVSARPSDVLLLSGYWPIVGTSIAVLSADGAVAVVAPEDEQQAARLCGADVVETFSPGSLQRLQTASDAVAEPLSRAMGRLGLRGGRIGNVGGDGSEPVSYVAMHRYGQQLHRLVSCALPAATLVPADDVVAQLKARLSAVEIGRLGNACRVAREAFAAAGEALRPGAEEMEAAGAMRARLNPSFAGRDSGRHLALMSGPRSAEAFGAYAESSTRRLAAGDLVLVHCNSQLFGFWTDITRTFCLGAPSERQRQMYAAIDEARAAALAAVRPGARAADVDAAARQVMTRHGFGDAFRHSTGHGVGYAAIDANALPRIHPKSPEVLETGMTFNIEPAAYLPRESPAFGMRHCDVVSVTDSGVEVLTDFQSHPDSLQLSLA